MYTVIQASNEVKKIRAVDDDDSDLLWNKHQQVGG